MIQLNTINTDTERAVESVRIKQVESKENEGLSFTPGQSKLSRIMWCPY